MVVAVMPTLDVKAVSSFHTNWSSMWAALVERLSALFYEAPMDKYELALSTLAKIESGIRPNRREVSNLVKLHNSHELNLSKEQVQKILQYGWCPACIRFVP